jgi:DNA-binding LacI/PurR family transcriptional regulator
VSRATVSYVLNGVEARVSEETRARVLEAARSLGYTPNAMASALRAGRTSVVIFALPNWPLGPVVAELLTGLVGELDRLGYTPLVHFVHAGGPDGLQKACDRVRPVGLIAPGGDLPPLDVLRANGTRGILTLGPPPEEGVPSFTLDQHSVGVVAIEHLVERGHERILAVTPLGSQLQPIGEERLAGARAAAQRLGVTLTDVPANGLDRGLAREPTAIYAFNDEIALGLRDALPPGVALIGTDDSPLARLGHPRLTTIRLNSPEGLREMARTLHALIEGREVDAAPIRVKPRVIQGETT